MMMSIVNLKRGKSVLKRLQQILDTPPSQRKRKFGYGWCWEITNGQYRIEDEFPELLPQFRAIMSVPKTIDDLEPSGP